LSKSTKYTLAGIMSGTSLDGLDIAVCEIEENEKEYGYRIIKADTLPYSAEQKNKLRSLPYLNVENYFKLHHQFGKFIGKEINAFLKKNSISADAIASHGHTVFHQPQKGFTTQIGCGATIAATTGLSTVCDFRSLDVALKGQGAPLVPIGDKLLFGEYRSCLNIGGIANISFDHEGRSLHDTKRKAFDICVANMALNHFAVLAGSDYDKNGDWARAGNFDKDLFAKLNALDFYKVRTAKSIGREWFEDEFLFPVQESKLQVNDILNTLAHHIAFQVADVLNENDLADVLITGGGAHNTFLIETLKKYYKGKVIIPSQEIVNYKEALIFALLGYLRLFKKINTLSSVTGAAHDSVGGAVYHMSKQ
jgi:anhydro-N-acetylmuramic acid kinase